LGMATMRGRVGAFLRVSAAAAAALAAFLLAGGCGDKEVPDIFAGAAEGIGGPVQPAQAAAGDISKSTLNPGARFTPKTLGLQPGGTIGELRFNWFSGNKDDSSQTFVRVFEGETLVASAEGTSGVTAAENFRYHKAEVAGLKPNTVYTYWVSNNGTDWSYEYTYKTPTPSGPFRFAAISDVQYDGTVDKISYWEAIAKRIGDAGASLIVNAGDHVEYCNASTAGGGENSYNAFFSPEELRRIPIASVMGNHDMCKNFDEHFNLPNIVDVKEKYSSQGGGNYNFSNYYFLYNKVLFVGLNTSPTPTSVSDAAEYVTDYRATIKKAKSENLGKYDFIVVTHHKSTASISAGGHVLDDDVGYYVSAGFQRLMTEESVNLVIAGHDHIYVRNHLMVDDDPVDDDTKGATLYLTLKPGGQTRNYNNGNGNDVGFEITAARARYVYNYPFLQQPYYRKVDDGKDYYLPRAHLKHSYYDGVKAGYTIIEAAYGKMTIEFHESDGSVFDRVELERKSVGITASGRLLNF
jgi:3',5'-cyclic AMP phosphodiesterase CpdA